MGISFLSSERDVRWSRVARRGLLLLLALLMPIASALSVQRGGLAQDGGTDYLWAGHTTFIGACASPSSAESLANCFSEGVVGPPTDITVMATDGTNVYFASTIDGGLSCPVDQFGQSCTSIMIGPWPSGANARVNALVAADGQLWIGQQDGKIYRCPDDLPWVNQSSMPDGCVLLDDAGNRPVYSLLLANGRLYAGLKHSAWGETGLIWSCDPQEVNQCEVVDEYGSTAASTLVAGSGYLWAGLDNGVLWRCDLNQSGCVDWDTAGSEISSISYDGQGIIYAAVPGYNSVVWSCPVNLANSCSNLRYPVNPTNVAAGAGGVFSSTNDDIAFNTSIFTSASMAAFNHTFLLYVPAGGPTGVGGIDLHVRLGEWSQRIGRHCDAEGLGKRNARVRITGPNGFRKSLTTDLCALRPGGALDYTFDLLDPGAHKIKVRSRGFIGTAKVDVEGDVSTPVTIRLKANR